MTTKGDLKHDLAPFVDEIKLVVKLPDGSICDLGEGAYRWDRDYDEAVWVLDVVPRAKQFASSAQETRADDRATVVDECYGIDSTANRRENHDH